MKSKPNATAAAALSWTFAEWLLKGKPSMLGAASGAVAGLVAITPACGWVGVGGALVIGLLAGVACFWGVTGLKKMLGADDSLDVFGIHGVGGITGAILTVDGVLHAGSPERRADLHRQLADHPARILPLIEAGPDGRYPLWRLVVERSVSINTAAAGGNTSLMTLAV